MTNVVAFPHQAERRSQQVTSWNADEDARVDGLPHRLQVLYLRGLRRHMDYATGIVGRVRKISIDQFRELLEYRPPAGSHEQAETFSRQQVTRMLDRLEQVGLVQRLHRGKGVRAPMEFWLPLAGADGVPEEVIEQAGGASKENPDSTGAGADRSGEILEGERARSEHGGASRENPHGCASGEGSSEQGASTEERATSGTSGVVEPDGSTTRRDARDSDAQDDSKKPTPKHRPEAAIQSKHGTHWGTAEDLELAEWMGELVDALPGGTENRSMAEWANTIRLMRERDGRELRHIRALFAWANQDPFWQANIRSPRKLRAQWKALAIKRNQERERAKAQEARHAQAGYSGVGRRRLSAQEARAQARANQQGGSGRVYDGQCTPGDGD